MIGALAQDMMTVEKRQSVAPLQMIIWWIKV
jgi:hypothetical protein